MNQNFCTISHHHSSELVKKQKRIIENIKRFDICSLLKVLWEMGYQTHEIHYESNADCSSRSSLCEGITFSEMEPKVRIILNLGLLAVNSPLPHFFRKKMDSGSIDPILFARYLNFFDHHLINNLLMMSMPDFNTTLFSNWQKTKTDYLKLLDFNSTGTLWHLFQACFPELTVKILKAPRLFRQNSSSVILGTTHLGVDSFLGKKIVQTTPSYKFILVGEETTTDLEVPWPVEIRRRLKRMIFSILQRTHIHFRVIFILKNRNEIARLAPSTQLGYCMLGKSKESLKLLLFSGYSKEMGNNLKDEG